jgi:hypothetical protein
MDFTQVATTIIIAMFSIIEVYVKYKLKQNKEEDSDDDSQKSSIKNYVMSRSLLNHCIFSRKHLIANIVNKVSSNNPTLDSLLKNLLMSLYDAIYLEIEDFAKRTQNNLDTIEIQTINREAIKVFTSAFTTFKNDTTSISRDDEEVVRITKKFLLDKIMAGQITELDNLFTVTIYTNANYMSNTDSYIKLIILNEILYIMYCYLLALEVLFRESVFNKKLLDLLKGKKYNNIDLEI